jgi:hypothetical protein
MHSVKTGTVPEPGEGIHFGGSLSVDTVKPIDWNSKSRVCLEAEHEGYELNLLFNPARIVRLKAMIKKYGLSQALDDTPARNRHDFKMGLDLSVGEISVEVLPPIEDDCAFCYLRLKDRRGGEANIDLGLDVAREIRKGLDAFFAKERAKQEARLA